MTDRVEKMLQDSAGRVRQAFEALSEREQFELHDLVRENMDRASAGEQPPRFELWADGIRITCLLDTERGSYSFVETEVLERAFALQTTTDSLGTN